MIVSNLLAMSLALSAGHARMVPDALALPQDPQLIQVPTSEPAPQVRAGFPFGIGERLVYDVKFGPIKVGTGAMELAAFEDVRGVTAFHSVFTVKGGTFFYHVNDRLESWMDTTTLNSLRFVQQLDEGSREREYRYEIYPEKSLFFETTKPSKPAQPSVTDPLDDASFLYFVRTVPLEVGKTYTFNRYFRPDRNPVVVKVLRRERIEVPAGTFDAVVIQPIIKAKGIFSEQGQAQIWLSADSSHMMLQMKSKLSFGSLNLYLRSYRHAAPTAAK